MDELSENYYLWHPRSRSGDVIAVNVTPGEQHTPPTKAKRFLGHLCESLSIDPNALQEVDILEYRSTYQADLTSDDWEDRWPLNWRILLRMKRTVPLPRFRREYVATGAFDAAGMDRTRTRATCLVISDFESEKDAKRCRERILSSTSLRKYARHYRVAAPRFDRVSLGKIGVQEQIEIGTFATSFFRDGPDYAEAVDSTCRENGGITNFEERTIERDELEDASGTL